MANRHERCDVCGETFSTTSNGDKHRKVVEVYDIWQNPAGELFHLTAPGKQNSPETREYIVAQQLLGDRLMSQGNQRRACVNPSTVGLIKNSHGVWTGPPSTRFERGQS